MTAFGKVEILAPAGTYEAMEAAVKAGCDAVYAGGSLFSARAYAGNFDEEAFLKALDYCHLHGVKVYMTINTLLKEDELNGGNLVQYLMPYYKAGLDAVLVQDFGVLKILKDNFPDLPIHASTQMSICSSYGAQFAKDLGMERIVPARELSLDEIKSIKEKVEIEIETFVHGAMCFAYSGKCLFSSFAGGRSGNRGRCAQPCRKCYELPGYAHEYLLSLKDLCTLEELPKLIDAGIDSFKIEGRMKNPSYVASTVAAYRKARDLYLELKGEEFEDNYEDLSDEVKERYMSFVRDTVSDLRDIYNRGGFYGGYYFTDKGKQMAALKRPNHIGQQIGVIEAVNAPKIAVKLEKELHHKDVLELRKNLAEEDIKTFEAVVELTSGAEGAAGETVWLNAKELKKIKPGMEVWRTRNDVLITEIENEILKSERMIPASCVVFAQVGNPLSITLTGLGCGKDGADVTIYVEGETVEAASNAPTTEDVLIDKMKKSGGSGVEMQTIDCVIDEDAFVRMSAFNALRREAAETLKEEIVSVYRR